MHKTAIRVAFENINIMRSGVNLPLVRMIVRSMERGNGLLHPRQFRGR